MAFVGVALSLVAAPPPVSASPVGKANEAANDLTAAIERYWSLSRAEPPTDPDGWLQFFATGERRIEAIEGAFARWSRLYDRAVRSGSRPPGHRRVGRFRDTMKVWIADLREQLGMSRACLDASSTFTDLASARECYSNLLSENGDRWQANTQAMLDARP